MGWFFRRRMSRSARLLWAAALVLMGVGMMSGCGQGSFLGRQYNDFTAYYNAFYNAKKAFEKGLESIDQSRPDVERTRYLSVFPTPQRGGGTRDGSEGGPFEEAIQKSANLLREHPNSKWVDDALLLIGKSYFYQQNYVGAAQKFREIITLDAEREGEAQFWLARTLVATGRYTEAAEALRTGLGNDEDYGTWRARMQLVRAELFVRQEQWEEAEAALEQGLEGSLPDEVGARGAFLLGQVRETREDYDGAQAAYRRVPEYGPRYQLEFAARLNAIEMEGLYGDTEEALRRLDELRRGDDTEEMRGEMAVVRARLYQEQGRSKDARRVLKAMLRGEEAPTGSVLGEIHYELGTLYRDAYEDFTQAAAHFDTAATSLSSPSEQDGSETERQAQILPRAPSNAGAQAERYRNLAERSQAVARMDSLLRIGRMHPDEYQAFVKQLRERRRKKLKARAERRRQQQFRDRQRATARQDQASQSPSVAAETQGSDAGFLFHQDPTLVQRGRSQFRQTWGDRPLVDNWRRRNAIRQSDATADGEGPGAPPEAEGTSGEEAARVNLNLSAIPRDSASQAEMEKKRVVARYELANALLRGANRPDSAETWYKRILAEHPDHPVARQALYALAQSYRAQGDTSAARKTYRRVVKEYPGTSYAQRSRQQLGLEQTGPSADVVESRADSAYARAYALWQSAPPDSALDAFLAVAETYPKASAAPRALLAAGVVYHQFTRRDSATVPRAQLERFLRRQTQPDSGAVDSSTTVADTTARGEGSPPPPDSLSGEAPKSIPDSSARSGQQTVDTTDAASRPEPSADSTAVDTAVTDSTVRRRENTPVSDSSRAPPRASPPQRSSTDSTRADASDRAPRPGDVRGDSTRAPADTTRGVGADTSAVGGSTGNADTTATAQGTPSDSVRAAPEEPDPIAPLKALLTYLTEEYPDTPHAERGQALLARLEQRASPDSASADTTAAQSASDTTATPSAPSTDSTAVPADTTTAPSDTMAAPPDTAAARRRPADTTRSEAKATPQPRRADSTAEPVPDTSGPSGSEPPAQPAADSTDGSWTVLVRTFEDEAPADTLRRQVQRRLTDRWAVEVLVDSAGAAPQYRLIVGRFDAKERATQARSGLPGPLAEESTVWALPPRLRTRR